MWVMQNDVLMQLPDDVPMPPNSRKVDVPDDFLAAQRDFKIANGALVREPKTFAPVPRLTNEEIAFLKEFVAKNTAGKKGEK